MKLRVILGVLLGSGSAVGATFVEEPGCYRVSGVLGKVHDRSFELVVDEGSRNRQALSVHMAEKRSDLKPGLKVVASLFAPKAGESSMVPFEVHPNDLSLVPMIADRENWIWRGPRTSGRCEGNMGGAR